jgi:DNA-binding PadR family transcriptional regulator
VHEEADFLGSPYARMGPEWWARRKMDFMMGERGRGRGHGRRHGGFPFGGFGPWGGFGGFPGQVFGPGPRVGRGDVRAAILVLLTEGPMHGYQVIQELTQRSGGMWRPSPGSVYPTLQQLEDEGLVSSSESDGRRVYQLTDSGKGEVEGRSNEPPPWEMTPEAEQFMGVREEGFRVAAATAQVVRAANPQQIARAKAILADARKRLYGLLAEDDEPEADAGSTDGAG